jgi:hypothetical protein
MLLASVYISPLRAWRDAVITELLLERSPFWQMIWIQNTLFGIVTFQIPHFLDLFVICNFEISAPRHPTHFVPNGRGDVLDIVVHRDGRLSEVRVLDIMDLDHLFSCFAFWIIVRLGKFWIRLKNFTDWERFQSLASALVSPRVEINSCIEVDKAARYFAASIASAYRLSTKTTTITDRIRCPSSLERLLKHKQRLRTLWQESLDPACKTAVNWIT